MSGTRAVEVMIFGSGGFVGSLMFTAQSITVGRDASAMVRLDEPSVSLRHAVLQLDGDGIRVKDLGSRTGTRVNGAPAPSAPLKPTDEIGIGTFRLRFTIHKAAQPAGPPSNGLAALVMPTPMDFSRAGAPPTNPPPGSGAAAVHRGNAPAVAVPAARPPMRSEDEETLIHKDVARSAAALFAEPEAPAPPPPQKRSKWPPPLETDGPTTRAHSPRVHTPPPPLPRPPANDFGHGGLDTPTAMPAAQPVSRAASVRPPPVEPAPIAVLARPATVPLLFNRNVPHAAAASAARVPAPERAPESLKDIEPFVIERPVRPRDHDEDDEDEDDANFVPPFDLLGVLARGGLTAGSPGDAAQAVVEVVCFREDRVLSVKHLGAQPLLLPGSKVEVGARGSDGAFVLYPKACGGAVRVRQAGTTTASAPVTESTLRLVPGQQALVDLGGAEGLLVHLVPRAPELAPPATNLKPSVDRVGPTAMSVGMHLLVSLFVGLVVLGGKAETADDVNAGRFATIDVKEIELEPPPPKPPEPDPVPTADVAPTVEPPMPVQNQPHVKLPKNAKVAKGETSSAQPSASTAKILSALGGVTGASSLNASAITNLDAVAAHGTGGFKVSGVVGKSPGDGLRVSAGGSDAQINTKSAAELGSVGRVAARTEGNGTVRGRVTTAPPAIQGEGHLDRGEIQRVINAHIYQIQGCYERQLMKDPGLSGKVSYQWLITPSGAVSGVRIGQSSLRSVEATTCIQSAIAGWKFPSPQGGSVTVTYPFSFVGN